MTKMTNRERFRAVMNFAPFDRLPVLEWANWWDKTVARWRIEGLPDNLQTREEIAGHFDLDIIVRGHVGGIGPRCPVPATHGAGLLKNSDDYYGIRDKLFPEFDHAVLDELARKQQNDTILFISADGFFWFPRKLFGIEQHLYAFYDHPELMHRMNKDMAEHMIRSFDEIFSVCVPDMVYLQEDLSFNKGPMLSKAQFDEFIRPYYDMVLPMFKDRGIPVLVDSDGDIAEPICWFEDAGIGGIQPLERQAGVDVSQLRKDHPKMRFMGAFDKLTMNQGEEVMRAEFERLLPTATEGGFVISCDHQTPPEVSYENYKTYVTLFREYAEKAGSMSQQKNTKMRNE